MTLNELYFMFGCTPTRCSLVVNQQLQFVSQKLQHNRKAKIYWQSSLGKTEFLVIRREPIILDVIGFTYGASLPIQCASDPISQAKNYNGYHHDTMCVDHDIWLLYSLILMSHCLILLHILWTKNFLITAAGTVCFLSSVSDSILFCNSIPQHHISGFVLAYKLQ